MDDPTPAPTPNPNTVTASPAVAPPVSQPTCNVPEHTRTIELQAAEIAHLKQELAAQNETMARLQQDMQALNQKYVGEIDNVARVQYEKDLVEHELEELSSRLFEEANAMVAQERREKWALEQELRLTQERLQDEQTQLGELRERMHSEKEESSPPVARAKLDLQLLMNTNQAKRASSAHHRMRTSATAAALSSPRVNSMPPPASAKREKPPLSVDQVQLEAFREFVLSGGKKKMHQFAYMKHCQAEDIDPCLRFGPHSRLSIKKLHDFISRQPCFIEQLDDSATVSHNAVPASARPLWERFQHTTEDVLRCTACGRPDTVEPRLLTYRFRLDETEEWCPIDQYCRDRLVAVCEFYVFIRNITKGFYTDRSIDDLYAENIRLRLQMFYSRYVLCWSKKMWQLRLTYV